MRAISQRWIHFVIGIKRAQVLVIEAEIGDAHTRRHTYAAAFAASNQFD